MQKRSQEPLLPNSTAFPGTWRSMVLIGWWWSVAHSPLNRMWNWICGPRPRPRWPKARGLRRPRSLCFSCTAQGGPERGQGGFRRPFPRSSSDFPQPSGESGNLVRTLACPPSKHPKDSVPSFWAHHILLYLASLKTCTKSMLSIIH